MRASCSSSKAYLEAEQWTAVEAEMVEWTGKGSGCELMCRVSKVVLRR